MASWRILEGVSILAIVTERVAMWVVEAAGKQQLRQL